MAGVKGMGGPEDVVPQKPQVQSMATPNVPEIDYDALVSEAAGSIQPVQNQPQEIDYDALVGQAAQEVKAEDPNRSFMDQVRQFPARLEASFAKNPEQKQFVLERRYGKENVRQNKDESFDIKKGDKWIKFDSDQFEILNDIFADWGRDVIEQGATEVATAGGIALSTLGAAGTGGASIPASAGIIAGSRLAGGAAGNALAQTIAYDVYGIPKPSVGEQATELAVSAGANALFGRIGDSVTNYFSKKAADRAARLAGQTVNESLQTDINVLKNAADELEAAGVIDPVTNQFGGKTTYLAEQATRDKSDEILRIAKAYAENPEVQNVKGKLMEGLNQVIQKINDKVAAVSPIKGSKVLEYAVDIEKAEGAIIGEFKKEALEQGGKTRVNADLARNTIKQSMEDLGYTFSDTIQKTPQNYVLNRPAQFSKVKDIQRPSIESLEARGFSPEAAKKLMDRLEANYKDVLGFTYDDKTKITFEKLSALNNNIKELVNEMYVQKDVNSKARKILTDVKDSFGDDYEKAIGAILGDSPAGERFKTAMSKFGEIKNAKKDLGRILVDSASGEPTVAAEALAKNLFSGSKQSLKEINAMKVLLKSEPEIWDQIRRVHLDELMKKNLKKDGITYDVNGFANDVLKLPKEIASELVGGDKNLNLMKSLRVYSDRLQNSTVESIAKSEPERKWLAKMMIWFTNYAQTKALASYDIAAAMGKGSAVSKYLSDEGRDQILKLVPVDGRPAVNRVIDNIIEAGAFSEKRAIKMSRMLVNGVGKPAAKIGTRDAAQDAISR